MTKVNLATVLALKEAVASRPSDRPHALVDASVLEDMLDDLVSFHTQFLDGPKKPAKKKK